VCVVRVSNGGILCRVNQVWELQAPRGEGVHQFADMHTQLHYRFLPLLSSGANARRTSKNSFTAAPPLPLHHEKRTSSITQQQQCKLPPEQYCGRFFYSSAINLPHISSGTAGNFHKFNALLFFVRQNECVWALES
jgi:hypothetical protein